KRMALREVAAYALVNATTRARYSMMLKQDVWDTLFHTQDFDAILTILSKTVYGVYLQIPRHSLTPRRVEYQIRWYLADMYNKLIHLTPEPGRQLLMELWRLYEVDNLKATLRGIETGASWDQVLHLLSPMVKYVTLTTSDMERMVRSGSVARAIELIHHTPYYETLAHALNRYIAERSLFSLEVALDLEHYRALWRCVGLFQGLDRTLALRLVGTLIDIENLLWAIRYRVYHQLSEQEIINYTLPFGYQIQDADIHIIASGSPTTLTDIIYHIIQRIYPEIVDTVPFESGALSLDSRFGLIALEQALQNHIANLCCKALTGYPFHVGVPVAYLMLTEREIRHLTSLIEWCGTERNASNVARRISLNVTMPVWVRAATLAG
ncbi:MAG: V-type ATPase subunit, partial [Anaerolineae bacterium]|nr:V-type ATPase subunit [Anaerolineae bacterium]